MISNGNSFGNSEAGAGMGEGPDGTGTERPGIGMGWMFPGGSSGIQASCNRM